MQAEWIEPAIWAVVFVAVIVFLGVAMQRARKRRRAEFSDEPVAAQPLAAPEPGLEPEPRQAEPEPVPEPEPEPVAEPEPTAEVAASVDPVLQQGLQKTQASLFGRLQQLFGRHPAVDAAALDELEEVLLTADVGVGLTTKLVDAMRLKLENRELDSPEALRDALKEAVAASLGRVVPAGDPLALAGEPPHVILFVGVNGVGKTTSIGKIAAKLRGSGHAVVLAAGDTFRAAAVQQLTIWGERTDSRVIRGEEGADPASVIFNAIEHAKQTGARVVLADTAGRLHTKSDLMEEIKKVKRAAGKAREGAPDETWLVVDATTGQNALQQAREFHQALGLTGVILTKLDGTARGGVVIAIADALDLPVRFVGVGETADDLRPFEARGFVEAMFAST